MELDCIPLIASLIGSFILHEYSRLHTKLDGLEFDGVLEGELEGVLMREYSRLSTKLDRLELDGLLIGSSFLHEYSRLVIKLDRLDGLSFRLRLS